MLTELRLPPLLILRDALSVAQAERVRIEASVPGLRLEKGRCFSRLDPRFFKKHVQVEQITALETLQNTPQLLCRDLKQRVDMNPGCPR